MPKQAPAIRSAKELTAIVDAALAEAKKASPDCKRVANEKTSIAWMSLPVPPKATMLGNVDGYVGMARCAEKEQFYALEKDLGVQLVKYGAGHHELVARGMIGMGDLKSAIEVLNVGIKAAPKDPNIRLAAAKVDCATELWRGCGNHAAAAIELAKPLAAGERTAIENRALKYLARAALHAGALDKAKGFAAASEKLGGDRSDLAEIRALITQAELAKTLVEPKYENDVPMGLYHLYGKVPAAGTLVELSVTNLTGKDTQYKADVAVQGVTQSAVQTFVVPKGKGKRIAVSPPMLVSFDPSAIRAVRASQITVKVTGTIDGADKTVYEQTLPINLQPRDFLPTYTSDGKDSLRATLWTVGAWITPNAKAIDGFLQKAKTRAPRNTFSGEQSDTFAQAKAIFEELKAQGMSYVMDPSLFAHGAVRGQRTRLPSESLKSTNAQCLEGAILYATLFEAIGLKPVVVTVPGHAFVGWRPSPKDSRKSKLPEGLIFLETTSTHDATFEQAVDTAMSEFREHDKNKKAKVIDVAKLRKLGITPQPID